MRNTPAFRGFQRVSRDSSDEKYHKSRIFPEKTMRLLECFFHETTLIRPRNGLSAKGRESNTKGLMKTGVLYTLLINRGNIGFRSGRRVRDCSGILWR
jgi:hypothetical protein